MILKLYIIWIYFNKYTLHVLCTHFKLYDCPEWNKLLLLLLSCITGSCLISAWNKKIEFTHLFAHSLISAIFKFRVKCPMLYMSKQLVLTWKMVSVLHID